MSETTTSITEVGLTVRLLGRFNVRDTGGRDCTPRSAKARGVLALLCQAPGHARPRRWLQAHLWSDRGPNQASGSLRQALLEIRRALGPVACLLRADRDEVALLATTTDLETDPKALAAIASDDQKFLRGLDPRDTAFSAWLAAERGRLRGLSARPLLGPSMSLPVHLRLGLLPGGVGGLAAQALADTIGKLLSESAQVEIFEYPRSAESLGLVLALESVNAPGVVHIRAAVSVAVSGQVLWSGTTSVRLSDPDAIGSGLSFARFAFQAAEAAQAALPLLRGPEDPRGSADVLIAEAIGDLFSFVPDRLLQADTRLALASNLRASPRSFAWRAFLRQVMALEGIGKDTVTLAQEGAEFAFRALELGSGNPLVLALVSQVHGAFDSNAETAAILARDALALSPCNAHAHAAQAGALLRGGRLGAARLAAARGADIAAGSLRAHWWDHIVGKTALAVGDLPAAISAYEAAHARAPAFRAPLRQLVILYDQVGDKSRYLRALGALRRIEPDPISPDHGQSGHLAAFHVRQSHQTTTLPGQGQVTWLSQIPPTPARTA